LLAVFSHLHNDKPTPIETIIKYTRGMLDMQGLHDRHLELCYDCDTLIGFHYAKVDHEGHKGFIKPEFIMEFYVIPEHRRKGYGKLMFNRLESLFSSHSTKRMYLTADKITGEPFWTALCFKFTGEVSPENNQNIFEKDVFPIREVIDSEQKAKICKEILESLTDWFGIPEAIADYTNGSKSMTFYACFTGNSPVGFVAVKKHNAYTAEVYVMGVKSEHHRCKIGKRLIDKCVGFCYQENLELLTVKTLDSSHPDLHYAKTRLF
jgi:GNAT superfamily N-acetyltransferase